MARATAPRVIGIASCASPSDVIGIEALVSASHVIVIDAYLNSGGRGKDDQQLSLAHQKLLRQEPALLETRLGFNTASPELLTWDQIAVHRDWIADQLDAPVTVATIAQRLRDDRGVDVSESTVRRYIATTFAEQHLEQKVTVPRGAVAPGSEAQIDYGKLGMRLDPATGRRVAVWVFAMILSCSRALSSGRGR